MDPHRWKRMKKDLESYNWPVRCGVDALLIFFWHCLLASLVAAVLVRNLKQCGRSQYYKETEIKIQRRNFYSICYCFIQFIFSSNEKCRSWLRKWKPKSSRTISQELIKSDWKSRMKTLNRQETHGLKRRFFHTRDAILCKLNYWYGIQIFLGANSFVFVHDLVEMSEIAILNFVLQGNIVCRRRSANTAQRPEAALSQFKFLDLVLIRCFVQFSQSVISKFHYSEAKPMLEV